MRFFLRPHRPRLSLIRVIQTRLLLHFATGFNDLDLALGLDHYRLLDKAHRVHVFDFATGAEVRKVLCFHVLLELTGAADRHVHIGAHIAVLHVAIAGPKVAQDLAHLADIGRRFFGATDVWARDDFHQRNTGPVQIDKGHMRIHVMDRLAGILFDVDTLNAHTARNAGFHIDDDFAFADNRMI